MAQYAPPPNIIRVLRNHDSGRETRRKRDGGIWVESRRPLTKLHNHGIPIQKQGDNMVLVNGNSEIGA